MPKKSRFRKRKSRQAADNKPHPEKRGLLASPGLKGQPLKSVYFFAGNTRDAGVYTANPLDARDTLWNHQFLNQHWVLDRMVQANINVITMSYWKDLCRFSPMEVLPSSLKELLDSIRDRPLVVMPAIEGGVFNKDHPDWPHWEFKNDFPTENPAGLDPDLGILNRIESLLDIFNGRMHLWAQVYDRDGKPRYAINIIQASSNLLDPNDENADHGFADGFERLAAVVALKHQVAIGFTLDAIVNKGGYSASPDKAGPVLEATRSVLAVQGFISEVFGDVIINGNGCKDDDLPPYVPHDNNIENIDRIIEWKQGALNAWLATGLPIYFDVSGGYDARRLFPKCAGFWGDNMAYTDDRWRNALSQMKRPGIKGITFNSWNGYTEGMVGVPTKEHGQTSYNWLRDLFEPLPWDHSHVHYANGAPTYRVYGAICEKWIELGGDRGFGAPTTSELAVPGGRKQEFAGGKSIYWSSTTGAHEIYGTIRITYLMWSAETGPLGFPTSKEFDLDGDRAVNFQRGVITFKDGDTSGTVSS